MAEWSLPDLDCPISHFDTYQYATYPPGYQEQSVQEVSLHPPPQAQPCMAAPPDMALHFGAPPLHYANPLMPKGDNPREIRNRAEKMRRDRLNQSVAELAAMVPPVVAARRKIDKTTVLRLTAHYLRAHQYVFGDSIGHSPQQFSQSSVLKVLNLFNGFLITSTYRGIVVVVSQNVQHYLGYTELDLLGQNLLNITHEDDRAILKEQLMPRSQTLGPNGELLIPDEPDAARKVEMALAQEKRRFIVRLKKLSQRSEPSQYVVCHIEGSLRKSDRACRGSNRCCQIVRRARARSENPCSSGNDIVFIGIVRPTSETFINESALESYCMEYRTRHSIDGEIIQCESRIALVTGYMTHEVSGVNAMNFMHRDDVRWVIIALREMYDEHRLFGESCYRLMTKNGQFIYMRTRGRLDVEQGSRAVTSFVCTNTVVDAKEGRHLIKMMRRKFTMLVNNNEAPAIEDIEEQIKVEEEVTDSQPAPIEDPRRLEQVILHLVTNLPSPSPKEEEEELFQMASPRKSVSPKHRLTIIPPNKERIVRSIEKIYTVVKTFRRHSDPEENRVDEITDDSEFGKQSQLPALLDNQNPASQEGHSSAQIVPYQNIKDMSHYIPIPESPISEAIRVLNDNEIEFNTNPVVNVVASPDMGYFDALPDPYSINISTVYSNGNQNGENIPQEPNDLNDLQFHVSEPTMNIPLSSFEETSRSIPEHPLPSMNNFGCGTKRPNDCEDYDIVCKKKITDSVRQNESHCDSPTFEQFFDENSLLYNNQIDLAINSLDCIDPTFPDLLTSENVQDILGQIENEQPIQNLIFSDYE